MNSTTYLINILENIKSIKNLRIEKKIVENVEKKELKYFKDKQFFNQNNNKYIFINAFIEESMIILVMFLSIFIKSESFSLVNLIIFTNIYQLTLSFLNNICEVIIMYKTYDFLNEKNLFKILLTIILPSKGIMGIKLNNMIL